MDIVHVWAMYCPCTTTNWERLIRGDRHGASAQRLAPGAKTTPWFWNLHSNCLRAGSLNAWRKTIETNIVCVSCLPTPRRLTFCGGYNELRSCWSRRIRHQGIAKRGTNSGRRQRVSRNGMFRCLAMQGWTTLMKGRRPAVVGASFGHAKPSRLFLDYL